MNAAGAFADLVHRLLVRERKMRLQPLVIELGLTYPVLYSRFSGRSRFRPREVNRLLSVYPDVQFVDYLLSGTAFFAIRRPAPMEPNQSYNPICAGLQSLVGALDLVRSVGVALHDNHADTERLRDIDRRMDQALRNLAMLRWCITYAGAGRKSTNRPC